MNEGEVLNLKFFEKGKFYFFCKTGQKNIDIESEIYS